MAVIKVLYPTVASEVPVYSSTRYKLNQTFARSELTSSFTILGECLSSLRDDAWEREDEEEDGEEEEGREAATKISPKTRNFGGQPIGLGLIPVVCLGWNFPWRRLQIAKFCRQAELF